MANEILSLGGFPLRANSLKLLRFAFVFLSQKHKLIHIFTKNSNKVTMVSIPSLDTETPTNGNHC